MSYTTAEDWLDRYKANGFSIDIDDAGMRPAEQSPRGGAFVELWDELRADKAWWQAVEALVRERVGAYHGWGTY
jgi:hypothetical protein